MTRFYCNGKKGLCDRGVSNNIVCTGCEFISGTGGEIVEISDYTTIPMQENDAGAKTIGEYFEKLLLTLWDEEDGFSGKRPFGNSGWKGEVYLALVSAGVVSGTIDEDGYLEDVDDIVADRVCREIISGILKGGE